MIWATLAQSMIVTVAQGATTAPSTKPAWAALFDGYMPLLVGVLVLMWVFVFRNKRKDEKKKKDLLSQIKRGDRVQTIGGIIGKVVETEETKILLKVDESSNTKIWFSRSAIFKVLSEEKAVEAAK